MKTLISAASTLALVLLASLASAAEVPFDQAQFDSAKAAGQPVAVVFHADWCPTCRAQAPLLKDLARQPEFALLMLIFGMGAAAPLVLLGSLSRTRMIAIRGRLLNAGHYGKQVFGIIMVGIGVLIATGTDKLLESRILDRSPQWLADLTTRF